MTRLIPNVGWLMLDAHAAGHAHQALERIKAECCRQGAHGDVERLCCCILQPGAQTFEEVEPHRMRLFENVLSFIIKYGSTIDAINEARAVWGFPTLKKADANG